MAVVNVYGHFYDPLKYINPLTRTCGSLSSMQIEFVMRLKDDAVFKRTAVPTSFSFERMAERMKRDEERVDEYLASILSDLTEIKAHLIKECGFRYDYWIDFDSDIEEDEIEVKLPSVYNLRNPQKVKLEIECTYCSECPFCESRPIGISTDYADFYCLKSGKVVYKDMCMLSGTGEVRVRDVIPTDCPIRK